MKNLEIWLHVSITCGVVGAAVVYSPFTNGYFTHEDGNYDIIEGDMRVEKNSGKSGLRDPLRLWPNRTIPFRINNTFCTRKIFLLNNVHPI